MNATSSLAVPSAPRILVVYGTRPEAIKMAPVVQALRRRQRCQLVVCAAAQHREMLDQMEAVLELRPDLDLHLMSPDQSLNDLTSRAVAAFDRVLAEVQPDWVLVQGDTTSAMTAGLAAFHRRIRVGHVEAGLRTGDLTKPFPEEANRRILDLFADALFAPTEHSRQVLLDEGVPEERIHLTGNTVVDSLYAVARRLDGEVTADDEVLVTVHRRESFGEPLLEIFSAIRDLAHEFPHLRWIYPVHPNPRVKEPAHQILGGVPGVELKPPLDYLELVGRLRRCRFVLTDSGGLQEEAPSFGKPLLVLRDTTERPEGVEAGVARLVGTDRRRIVTEVRRLLGNPTEYDRMARTASPYGDGAAADRIAAVVMGEPWEPFWARRGG